MGATIGVRCADACEDEIVTVDAEDDASELAAGAELAVALKVGSGGDAAV